MTEKCEKKMCTEIGVWVVDRDNKGVKRGRDENNIYVLFTHMKSSKLNFINLKTVKTI